MNGYLYDDLLQDLSTFPSVYAVGHSTFGKTLWAIRIGEGAPMALIHGAIHAREHITSPLVVAMARTYLTYYKRGMPAIDFVPMVDPDGVDLCQKGVTCAPFAYQSLLLDANEASRDFSLWKANGRGVDLNVNFPASWGKGASNVFCPAYANYVGKAPCSEKETRALIALSRLNRYRYTLSYHCKGEIVYYGFGQGAAKDHSKEAAKALCDLLGYTPSTSLGSCGGYKDWYATRFPNGVALTVEVGEDAYEHPFPYRALPALIDRHAQVAPFVARYIEENLWTLPLCDKPSP